MPGEVDKVCGVPFLNDSKYSYDVLDGEFRLTAVRSPIFADHYGVRDDQVEYMDQGVQEFSYVLVPHAGDWKESGAVRKAYQLNVPPSQLRETYHESPLPQSVHGISVSHDRVVVTAFKQAEERRQLKRQADQWLAVLRKKG